jgi:hypothetical protein
MVDMTICLPFGIQTHGQPASQLSIHSVLKIDIHPGHWSLGLSSKNALQLRG